MNDIQKLIASIFFGIFVILIMKWIYSEFSMGHRVMEYSKQAVIYCGENNVKAVTLDGFECNRAPPPAKPSK